MHLLAIEDLTANQIIELMDIAQQHINAGEHLKNKLQVLSEKTLFNFFLENSTRTRVSFEVAAKRLGCQVISVDIAKSSMNKGESLLDTVDTLRVMGCDYLVIRSTEINAAKQIAEHVGDKLAVINAGDGNNEHPSQALLDMLTIRQYKDGFKALKIAIIGDIAHSRVARSNIAALKKLGVTDIRIIAPAALLPETDFFENVQCFTDLQQGLADVDVMMSLRIQKERMQKNAIPDEKQFHQQFGLTPTTIKYAKPDAIIMHPAPMNRGVEISSQVADGPQSVIFKQIENGVAMRMAILQML